MEKRANTERRLSYTHKKIMHLIYETYGESFKDMSVLQIGGYDGFFISNLPKCKLKINLEMDGDAFVNYDGIKNIQGDIQKKTEFADKYFDLVIFSEVLEHLAFPRLAVKEITRLTSTVILTTPNNSITRKIIRRLALKREPELIGKRQSNGMKPGEGHIKEYSRNEVIKMFEDENFELIHSESIGSIIPSIDLEKYPTFGNKMLIVFKEKWR